MTAIDVRSLSYAYGRAEALHDVTFALPAGAFHALLGPNGAGKTTLLQLVAGLRRPARGRVALFGVDTRSLGIAERGRLCYVAEGQRLPARMTLARLEAYLAPLYPGWDPALAATLRDRFALDPRRRLGTLSRGERMKAALLCALAPRPRLLLMDEPFTGLDALVKEELVRGLLASAGDEGWTVVIASHDLAELETLADWVGFLQHGRLRLHASLDELRARYRHVSVVGDGTADPSLDDARWLAVERAGRRLAFITPHADAHDAPEALRSRFPGAERVELREASLRELFVALAQQPAARATAEVAA